jgi:hypothetical protein
MALSIQQKRIPGIFLRGKVQWERKANNLVAILDPTVYKMWDPRRLRA